eukprot:760634_1
MSATNPLHKLTQKSFESLLGNQDLSDVTFVVCNESLKEKPKEYHCVRAIFASFSSVFEKMLFGSMVESFSDNQVIITDVSCIAFEFLQSLFYGLPVELTEQNVVHVLYAANKYIINDLVAECNAFISSIANMNDLILALKSLRDYKLFDISSQIVDKRAILTDSSAQLQLFDCDNFTQIPQYLLVALLKSNLLNLKEEIIWEKCRKWSQFQCSVTQNTDQTDDVKLSDDCFMKPLLPHIRYTLMPNKFFAEHVVPTNLLSKDDVISIFCHMACAKNVKINFNASTRMQKVTFDTYCEQFKHYVNKQQNIFEHKGDSTTQKLLFASNVKWTPNSGIHSWSIKCWTKGTNHDGIGIMSDIDACQQNSIWFHKDQYHPVFWYATGNVYKKGSAVTELKAIENGDVVQFILDCNQWNLTIIINDKKDDQHMHVVSDIDQVSYYPVVNVRGKNAWKYQML